MSHFKARVHQIRFLASVRLCLRRSLTLSGSVSSELGWMLMRWFSHCAYSSPAIGRGQGQLHGWQVYGVLWPLMDLVIAVCTPCKCCSRKLLLCSILWKPDWGFYEYDNRCSLPITAFLPSRSLTYLQSGILDVANKSKLDFFYRQNAFFQASHTPKMCFQIPLSVDVHELEIAVPSAGSAPFSLPLHVGHGHSIF